MGLETRGIWGDFATCFSEKRGETGLFRGGGIWAGKAGNDWLVGVVYGLERGRMGVRNAGFGWWKGCESVCERGRFWCFLCWEIGLDLD